MKYPIFLFGSGRCGSTLFQRVLNTHKEIVMYGEHEGFLGPLASSYRLLTQSRNVQQYVYGAHRVEPEVVMGGLSNHELDICWVNNFTESQVKESFRRLVLDVLAKDLDLDRIHWGFKEIRYRKDHNALEFLREAFPDCRMIFVFRHPVAMVASAISAWREPDLRASESEEDVADFVRRVAPEHFSGWFKKNSYLYEQSASGKHRSLVMHYEDLIGQRQRALRRLFDFIEKDVPAEAVNVLNTRVASTEELLHKGLVTQVVEELFPRQPAGVLRLAGQLGY